MRPFTARDLKCMKIVTCIMTTATVHKQLFTGSKEFFGDSKFSTSTVWLRRSTTNKVLLRKYGVYMYNFAAEVYINYGTLLMRAATG